MLPMAQPERILLSMLSTVLFFVVAFCFSPWLYRLRYKKNSDNANRAIIAKWVIALSAVVFVISMTYTVFLSFQAYNMLTDADRIIQESQQRSEELRVLTAVPPDETPEERAERLRLRDELIERINSQFAPAMPQIAETDEQ